MTVPHSKLAVSDGLPPSETSLPASLGLRIGYGVGQLGVQILRDMPTVLLPSYITLIMGLPAWIMSLVIFVPKIWLIFADILFGTISDRTNTRWGRRRPYLLIGAVSTPFALFALFAGPLFEQTWVRVAYIMAAYAVASTTYSIFSVPYLSMGAELSPDSRERTKIMSVRTMFLAAGLIVGTGATPVLIKYFGGGREGYRGMAAVLGLACFLAMIACFFGTRNVRSDAGINQKFSLVRQWKVIRSNKPFLTVASFHFIQLLAGASQSTVFFFFMIYIGGHPLLLFPMTIINSSLVILAQPFWVKMALRFGKKQVYMVALICWSMICSSWFFVHPDSVSVLDLPWIGSVTMQDLGVIGRYVISGFFNGALTLISVAMMTDTVEHDRKITGVGQEGVFSGAWSAMEKTAVATGPLWVGPFLQIFGFEHATTGAVVQSQSAILGVALTVAIIPAALNLLTLPLVLRYPGRAIED